MTTPGGGEQSLGSRLGGGVKDFASGVRQGHNLATGRKGNTSANAPSSKVKVDASDITALKSALHATAAEAKALSGHLKDVRDHLAAIGKTGMPNMSGATGTGSSGSYLSSSTTNVPKPVSSVQNTAMPRVNLLPNMPSADEGGGRSRFATAGHYLGGGAAIAATIGGYGASYLGKHLNDMIDRQQGAQAFLLAQGKSTSYDGLQQASRSMNNAFRANSQGYADTTKAGGVIGSMGAIAGTKYGSQLVGATNAIASLNPTMGVAQAAAGYQAMTSVSSYYAGRQAGINMAPGQRPEQIFDQIVRRISRTGSLSASQLAMAQMPGSRLNHDLVALGLPPEMIDAFVRYEQNKNQGGKAGLRNTLGGDAQKLGSSQGNRQTATDRGMVKGVEDAMGLQTSANNAIAGALDTGPGAAATRLTGALGQLDSSIKLLTAVMGARGLMGMLGRLGGNGGGGGILGRVLGGGRGLAGRVLGLGRGAAGAAMEGLAGVGAGTAALGGLAVAGAVGDAYLIHKDIGLFHSMRDAQKEANKAEHRADDSQHNLADKIEGVAKANGPAAEADYAVSVKPFLDALNKDPHNSRKQGEYNSAVHAFVLKWKKRPAAMAGGGVVPGMHNRDDVNINATPGEVVVPKHIVHKFGGATSLMKSLGFMGRKGGDRFATGGEVLATGEKFVGMPYHWGGSNPKTSFDCSGLVQYAYGQNGVQLPRVAKDQARVGTAVAPGSEQPGDLLFYGKGAGVHHVAMYAGSGQMLEAPHTGAKVRITKERAADSIKRILSGGGKAAALNSPDSVSSASSTGTGGGSSGAVGDVGAIDMSFGSQNSSDFLLNLLAGGGLHGPSRAANHQSSSATGATSDSTGPTGKQVGSVPAGNAMSNARIIVGIAKKMGLSKRGAIIGIATAEQESNLINLHSGDRDSQGLFQQRPSQGWGTVAQVTDPAHAATSFFSRLKNTDYNHLPLTVAAQKVQISGYPNAYAKWEKSATEIVNKIGYKSGSYELLHDEIAQLHKGEAVLNEKDARMMRDVVESKAGGGKSGGHSCIHVEGTWTFQVASASEEEGRKFAAAWRDEIERTHRVDMVGSGH